MVAANARRSFIPWPNLTHTSRRHTNHRAVYFFIPPLYFSINTLVNNRLQTMVDETLSVIVSIVAGIAGGFLSSWMAFNASGETFSGRKHGNALIIGALSGLALGVTMVVADPSNMTDGQFVIAVILVFLAAVGIDRLRSSGADMVANNPTLSEKKASPA